METLKNETFPKERDLYNKKDLILDSCRFEGEEDGESALKECTNIKLLNTYMDLRYPLWHDDGLYLDNVTQTVNCRAALWYSKNITITNSKLGGIKALRECENIEINNTSVESPEFGWRSKGIKGDNVNIISEYIFFEAKDMSFKNSIFKGKYGFQYMDNVEFDNCIFDTKDAFWHGNNITVKNSYVKGEYLGWYSCNLTFINCTIDGIQPLCYCKNLKLIDCKMLHANETFEYSDVEASIIGSIDSVKNPLKGIIEADEIKEINITDDRKYPSEAKIIIRKK